MPRPRRPLTATDERHGTNAGWAQHRRDGSEVCEACAVGHNEYMRDWRETRRLLGAS